MHAEPIDIAFRLNGDEIALSAAADAKLIDLLRDRLEHSAAKQACAIGRCSACTVLVDGIPANACLLMAWQLEGRDIVTPEGLDADNMVGVLRQCLAEENAFQCGYCAPGFTVTLTALLQRRPDAGEADIRAALEGNICRCTGYHSIIRGALAAAQALRNGVQGATR